MGIVLLLDQHGLTKRQRITKRVVHGKLHVPWHLSSANDGLRNLYFKKVQSVMWTNAYAHRVSKTHMLTGSRSAQWCQDVATAGARSWKSADVVQCHLKAEESCILHSTPFRKKGVLHFMVKMALLKCSCGGFRSAYPKVMAASLAKRLRSIGRFHEFVFGTTKCGFFPRPLGWWFFDFQGCRFCVELLQRRCKMLDTHGNLLDR